MHDRALAAAIQSVVGTIDIAADDPDLAQADMYLKGLVDRSIHCPFLARDERTMTRKTSATRRPRG